MSKRYSIADARNVLPRLVAEAEAGLVVELTRRGKPVAVLLSMREHTRIKGARSDFKQAYADFRSRFDLAEVGLEVIDWGQVRSR